jgi:HNH endonuclease
MNVRVRGTCTIENCTKPHFGLGYCNAHYARFKKYGDATFLKRPPNLSIEERFLRYVQKTENCWLWLGHISRLGYGSFFSRQFQSSQAHRVSYQLFIGEVPKELTLDHLCRVRHCVNPDHLEPVTLRENILRGTGPSAILARRTHCKHGHPWDESNTIYYANPKGVPKRHCRQCIINRGRRNRAKEKAARSIAQAAIN